MKFLKLLTILVVSSLLCISCSKDDDFDGIDTTPDVELDANIYDEDIPKSY